MVEAPLRDGPLHRADQALAERLLAAFPALRFAHDVMPPRFDKRAWDRLTRRTPFVGRGWTGWQASPAADRVFRGRASWEVYLIDRNARADSLSRGDSFAPGLFAMTQAAVGALHGWTVPDLGTWMLAGAANSYADEWTDETAGLVALTASLVVELDPPDADEFLRLATTWSFPPIEQSTQLVRSLIP